MVEEKPKRREKQNVVPKSTNNSKWNRIIG
jgi:hypothetical protein